MAVPDYGLDAAGKRSYKLGDCTADLVLVAPSSETELHWRNADGKLQEGFIGVQKRACTDGAISPKC